MDNNSQPQDSSGEAPVALVPLRVMGISYSQIQTGVFALILAQTDGPFRIPVMIGKAEAQAIATRMEGVVPPRPMTHDLFAGVWKAFGIRLEKVLIYRFEDGVFYSELYLTDGEREIKLDCRTSDAVAIAMRTGSPIFTTPEVLSVTGFEMEVEEVKEDPEGSAPSRPDPQDAPLSPASPAEIPLERYATEELERMLGKLIEDENYEDAARVSRILKSRK